MNDDTNQQITDPKTESLWGVYTAEGYPELCSSMTTTNPIPEIIKEVLRNTTQPEYIPLKYK